MRFCYVISHHDSFKTLKDNKDKTLKENKPRQFFKSKKPNKLKAEEKEGSERSHSLSAPCTPSSPTLAQADPGKQANTFSDRGAHPLGPRRQKQTERRETTLLFGLFLPLKRFTL